jgi:hypothetical protein
MCNHCTYRTLLKENEVEREAKESIGGRINWNESLLHHESADLHVQSLY